MEGTVEIDVFKATASCNSIAQPRNRGSSELKVEKHFYLLIVVPTTKILFFGEFHVQLSLHQFHM